jgi:hypothetical protein
MVKLHFKGKKKLGNPGVYRLIILNWIFKKSILRSVLGSAISGDNPIGGFREYVKNKFSGFHSWCCS